MTGRPAATLAVLQFPALTGFVQGDGRERSTQTVGTYADKNAGRAARSPRQPGAVQLHRQRRAPTSPTTCCPRPPTARGTITADDPDGGDRRGSRPPRSTTPPPTAALDRVGRELRRPRPAARAPPSVSGALSAAYDSSQAGFAHCHGASFASSNIDGGERARCSPTTSCPTSAPRRSGLDHPGPADDPATCPPRPRPTTPRHGGRPLSTGGGRRCSASSGSDAVTPVARRGSSASVRGSRWRRRRSVAVTASGFTIAGADAAELSAFPAHGLGRRHQQGPGHRSRASAAQRQAL